MLQLESGLTFQWQGHLPGQRPGTGWSSKGAELDNSTFSVTGAVGWSQPVSAWTSFWPRLAVGVGFQRADALEGALGGSVEERTTSLGVSLSAPLIVHPVRHFFFGAGPRLLAASAPLGYASAVTVNALEPFFTLGGWL